MKQLVCISPFVCCKSGSMQNVAKYLIHVPFSRQIGFIYISDYTKNKVMVFENLTSFFDQLFNFAIYTYLKCCIYSPNSVTWPCFNQSEGKWVS